MHRLDKPTPCHAPRVSVTSDYRSRNTRLISASIVNELIHCGSRSNVFSLSDQLPTVFCYHSETCQYLSKENCKAKNEKQTHFVLFAGKLRLGFSFRLEFFAMDYLDERRRRRRVRRSPFPSSSSSSCQRTRLSRDDQLEQDIIDRYVLCMQRICPTDSDACSAMDIARTREKSVRRQFEYIVHHVKVGSLLVTHWNGRRMFCSPQELERHRYDRHRTRSPVFDRRRSDSSCRSTVRKDKRIRDRRMNSEFPQYFAESSDPFPGADESTYSRVKHRSLSNKCRSCVHRFRDSADLRLDRMNSVHSLSSIN